MITSGSVSIAVPTTTPTLVYESPRGMATQIVLNAQALDSSGGVVAANVGLVIGDSNIFYDTTGANNNRTGVFVSTPYTSLEFSGALYAIPAYGASGASVEISFTAFDTK